MFFLLLFKLNSFTQIIIKKWVSNKAYPVEDSGFHQRKGLTLYSTVLLKKRFFMAQI